MNTNQIVNEPGFTIIGISIRTTNKDAIEQNTIPPTMNIENLDNDIPEGIQIVQNHPKKKNVNVAMSNAFGFGGHNATVVFKKM